MKNIPLEIGPDFDEAPCIEIMGMCDIIIHKYFGMELKLTWEIVKVDIPELKRLILKINEILE